MSVHQTYSAAPVFRIYRTEIGRWCARSIDGAIGGTFFDRAAALRFAEREGAVSVRYDVEFGPHLLGSNEKAPRSTSS
ncbi:MAG: hypothetical protein JO255_02205 [Alphaproteobacteria bacterium]|nr:hypothetical protein [Alphaproteobacteria bacterium]